MTFRHNPSRNGEFWPAEMWGRISRLNTEFRYLIGTFQTCRWTPEMSAYWGRPEVISADEIDPKRTSAIGQRVEETADKQARRP